MSISSLHSQTLKCLKNGEKKNRWAHYEKKTNNSTDTTPTQQLELQTNKEHPHNN